MGVLLGIAVVDGLLIACSAFIARRAGRIVLALPIVIATIGAVWLFGALTHYRRSTGRELQGLVGYHYSVPEWGFKYAHGGAEIERWSFHVPAAVTFVLLFASGIAASLKRWRKVGAWGMVGLWLYHVGCAAAVFLVYAAVWVRAASVFI